MDKNVKKRIVFKILSIVLCFVILSGCKAASSHLQSDGVSEINAEQIADSTTYVYTAQGFLPISYVCNGKQLISEGLSLRELYNILPSAETLPKIEASQLYINNNLPERCCYNSHEVVMNTIASDGNWDFFPIKVRYEKYTLNNQPNRPEWTEYFKKKINQVSPDTPVIFEEAYFFDWNGDGTQSVIVNAGNTFEKALSDDFFKGRDLPTAPTPPPSDITAFYQLSAIFTYQKNGTVTYDLLNNICSVTESLSTGVYIPPQDSEDLYSLDYYSVQKDRNGNLMICPFYADHITWESIHQYAYNYAYLLSDIDGDGKSELIVHWPVHYGFLRILQSNGGKIEEFATICTL